MTQPVTPGEVMKQEPSTEAGRALAADWASMLRGVAKTGPFLEAADERMHTAIIAIEAEARGQGRMSNEQAMAFLDEKIAAAEARANTPSAEVSSELERNIRQFLWLNHGHTMPYGDDGEMQCQQCGSRWDYLRQPLDDCVLAASEAVIVTRLAPSAVSDVGALDRATAARVWEVVGQERSEKMVLQAQVAALRSAAYWYRAMVRKGGPDGSELDTAVEQDLDAALGDWRPE